MNWFYVLNGQQVGPVTQAQLEELAQAGTIKADTLVWREGLSNWLPYSQAMGGTAVAGQPPVMGQAAAEPFGQTSPFGAVDATEQARKAVQGPGIVFIVLGALTLIGSLYNLAKSFASRDANMAEMEKAISQLPPEAAQFGEMLRSMMEFSTGPLGLFFGALGIAAAVILLMGGVRMRQLRSYGLAMTAAILSVVGCLYGCCCVATIPVGIWAIVVLMKPEVKAAFR